MTSTYTGIDLLLTTVTNSFIRQITDEVAYPVAVGTLHIDIGQNTDRCFLLLYHGLLDTV